MAGKEEFEKINSWWKSVQNIVNNPRYLELNEKWKKYCLGEGARMTEEEWTEHMEFMELELNALEA